MNDSTIAFRAKEQLGKFWDKVFTHFSRPRQKFLADMLYGIQALGDTRIPRGVAEPPQAATRGVLSSVMRTINDDSKKCHAVEKRLSRNVADETVGDEIDKAILEAGAKFVRDDTLILVDPTEIRKYVAGTGPTNVTSVFTAAIEMVGGKPKITWSPDLNEGGAKAERVYRVFGAKALDGQWFEVDGNEADYNFFSVTVELP